MSYHYLNNLRLQLWFDTPNVCAVFLVMTVMLTIGAQMFLSSGKTLAGKIPSVLLALAAAIQLFLLAMTYSRGGYIAIAAALTLAALLAKNRRVFIAYGAVFALSLLLVNNGLERVNSMADVAEGSILHRLWLWRGGLGIIADHPLGVPAVEVGRIYSMWYKPLWLNEEYFSLINDYLTVAAVYGLLALFICLTAVFTVAGFMRYYLKGRERDPAACLLGALAGYLTAAFFSTFYVHSSAIWLFAVIFAGALAWVVYGVCRRRLPLKKVDFIAPAAAAFLVCLGIFIAGCVVNSLQPFSYRTASLPESEAKVITCMPKKNPEATIVYFYENDVSELNRKKIRSVVRPLLEHGYHVIAANIDVGLGGLAEVAKVLDMARRDALDDIPLVLLGIGHAARLMVIGAADHAIRPAGILALDLAASWPWEELSPDRHLHKLKVPLKLIWRKESPVAGVEDMRILQKSGEENNLDLTVSLLDAEEYSAADLLRAIEQTIRPGGERKKPASAKIAVEFFYRDGCKECEKVKAKVLPMLEDQFPDLYELHYHNLADGEKYLKLAAYQEYFRSDSNAPVSMVVNSSVLLSGYDEIAERLCREVEVQSKQSPVLQNDAMGTTDQADLLSKRVARFSLIAVAIAGFIDGINPCVFGALIFFIQGG